MLSRSSSDAGTRLRRSKSASTVHRHQPSAPGPLDPRVAQQHAVAAATTAFVRAHGPVAAERSTKRSSELSRAKSTSSRKSLTSEGSHFPPRGSSVRSAKTTKAGQAPGVQRESQAPTMTMEKFPSFYPTPAPGGDRPLSAQPSITFNENTRPSSQHRSQRPSAVSSATSQQIRKARSMYYASSVQTGSPIARPPAKYLTTPPLASVSPPTDRLTPVLPVRNAAPSPLASPHVPVTVDPGDTINNARDKYLQGFQQHHRQVKHRPSLFLAPFKKRQDRLKAKERPLSAGFLSAHTGSRQAPSELTTELFDDFGMPKQKKEKRSFSNSLKDKFKKVFRRTSNNEQKSSDYTMPVQQIEASRDYFNYHASAATSNRSLDIPSPDDETLLRVRSRGPSLERMPSPLARPGSRGSTRSRGSNRSLHSEANAVSSRVTSWSDSSASNTLTQRDIKRLTVIHESKDSVSSEAGRSISSVSLRRRTVPLPTFSAFKDPMPMESLLEETSTPVDPKRVFSALMKEIDTAKVRRPEPGLPDGSPGAESDVFESSATKELHAVTSRELHSSASKECRTSTSSDQRPISWRRPNTAQSKTSSIRSLGKALRSTIRTVTPAELKSSPMPQSKDAGVLRRPETSNSSRSTSSEHGVTIASIVQKKHVQVGTSTPEDLEIPNIVTPSAGQLEQRMTRSKERWKTPLDEHCHHGPLHHRSHARTFSASQYTEVAIRTPATVVGIPPLPELEGDSPKETPPTEVRTTPVNTASRTPRPNPIFSPLSPSIYSRNTDGISILPNDSVMSFDGTNDDPDDAGSAVIVTSRAVKRHVLGTPSPRQETDSTRLSKDWKAWLSREVSELGSPMEALMIKDEYTLTIRNEAPLTRHYRELTQIQDDSTTILARGIIDTRSSSPSAQLSQTKNAEADSQQATVMPEDSPSSAEVATKDQYPPALGTSQQKCAGSPLVRSPAIREERHSSAHSHRSARSRSSISTPKSSTMNERFPFIDTGRRTSVNSARFSRSSRSATDSGSSTRSKGTPVSKVYSDVSAPVTVNWASQNTPQTILKETYNENKENRREGLTASTTQTKRPDSAQFSTTLLSSLTTKQNRPKSMLSISPAQLNRTTSPLKRFMTIENEDLGKSAITKVASPSTSSRSPQRQRMRTNMPAISPTKLTMRPKSAFELRSKGALPLTPSALNAQSGPTNESSKKKVDRHATRTPDPLHMPMTGRSNGIDQDTLHILLESPWALSGQLPSPRSSLETTDRSRTRPKLNIKHSSSTLALHREPSPGFETQTIDAVIDERPLSRRSNFSEKGNGRATPGQRMAEQFLRERTGPRGSGAGTPCSDVEQEVVRTGPTGTRLEMEDTPAFL
ncbi:hypothetical protein BU23DRAFT_278086 [Bimuria novae-zelandiae CBS 107.79]|uniref:Uncharacterized protein n=1 Tax=Bimuria novae-zelandiae CBS 107.79 TaxID=1447943 RepID=A0A6A5UTJ4_9PLEO|nr:hypothetical protein BU23DRAFT_278086 [Bimuria novae-zelandiae CBS 107.79]